MAERYRHTQIGYLTIGILIVSMLLIVFLMNLYDSNPIPFVLLIILFLCLLLFSTLTVIIDEQYIEIRFGPGLIRKKYLLREIASCRTVKNPWYYGWGIHLTPHGWLYNISGLQAVEITTKSGKRYRIGTDVPGDLERALKHSIT